MRNVPVGTKGSYAFTVAREHLASTADSSLPAVLASKEMVLAMEFAAIYALRAFLDPGECSVGMTFDIQHVAATPPGHRVRVEAEVVKAEGRRLEFKVRAADETEEIGSGIHRRAVIDYAKFNERLKAKLKQ